MVTCCVYSGQPAVDTPLTALSTYCLIDLILSVFFSVKHYKLSEWQNIYYICEIMISMVGFAYGPSRQFIGSWNFHHFYTYACTVESINSAFSKVYKLTKEIVKTQNTCKELANEKNFTLH